MEAQQSRARQKADDKLLEAMSLSLKRIQRYERVWMCACVCVCLCVSVL